MIVPHVLTGVLDDLGPSWRFVLEIPIDGSVVIKRECFFSPEDKHEHPWRRLTAELATAFERMEKEPLPGTEGGPLVSAQAVMIRADLNAPFESSLKIMELCAEQRIRHIQFAVGDARKVERKLGLQPSTTWEQRLELTLPLDLTPPVDRTGPGPVEVSIRVLEAGRKLEMKRDEDLVWKEKQGTRFRLDLSTRKVEYTIGARQILGFSAFCARLQGMHGTLKGRPLVIDVGEGVTTAEALLVLDAGRNLGVGGVTFVTSETENKKR